MLCLLLVRLRPVPAGSMSRRVCLFRELNAQWLRSIVRTVTSWIMVWMRQSDPLKLLVPGTLDRPGPYGRLVRLALGVLCAYVVLVLFWHAPAIIDAPATTMAQNVALWLPAVLVFNYVVNIGFGKDWGRRPLYLSASGIALAAFASRLLAGTFDHAILGATFWGWLLYFYGHAGISFLLAALMAMPGCEMRAIPEAVARPSGRRATEHSCPASLITKLDEWEQRRGRRC